MTTRSQRRSFPSPTICLLSIITLSSYAVCALATPTLVQTTTTSTREIVIPNSMNDVLILDDDAQELGARTAKGAMGSDNRLHPLCNIKLGGKLYDLCPLMNGSPGWKGPTKKPYTVPGAPLGDGSEVSYQLSLAGPLPSNSCPEGTWFCMTVTSPSGETSHTPIATSLPHSDSDSQDVSLHAWVKTAPNQPVFQHDDRLVHYKTPEDAPRRSSQPETQLIMTFDAAVSGGKSAIAEIYFRCSMRLLEQELAELERKERVLSVDPENPSKPKLSSLHTFIWTSRFACPKNVDFTTYAASPNDPDPDPAPSPDPSPDPNRGDGTPETEGGDDFVGGGVTPRKAAWGVGSLVVVVLVMSGAGYAAYTHSPVVRGFVDEHLPENVKGMKLGLPYPFSVTALKRRAGYQSVEIDPSGTQPSSSSSSAPSPTSSRPTFPIPFPSWSGARAGLGINHVRLSSSLGAVGNGISRGVGKGRRTFLGRPDAERLRTWQLEEEFDLGEDFGAGGVGGSLRDGRYQRAAEPSSSRLGDEEGAWVNANANTDNGSLSTRSSRTKPKRWSRWIPSSPLKSSSSHTGSHSAAPVDFVDDTEQQVEFECDEGVPLAPSPKKYGGVGGGHSKGYGSAN